MDTQQALLGSMLLKYSNCIMVRGGRVCPRWPADLTSQHHLLGSPSSARRAASASCADPELEADLCTSTRGGVEGPAVEPEGPAPAKHAYIHLYTPTFCPKLTLHNSIETLREVCST